MGLQESDAAEHMKLNCTCFDEWYGHNKNWDFMLEFLVFLTSHMQSNSRVYQFLFHTLLNKTLCDPPLATFPTAAQILPCPPHPTFTLLYFNCSDFLCFSNLSSSLLTQNSCTCFSIYLELFPQIFI